MTTFLTLASCLSAVALLAVVALYLIAINRELDLIGGSPSSHLAKIRFGLRAIEKETGHLGPEAQKLNSGLGSLHGGLHAVEGELARIASNLKGGKG